VAPAPDGFDTGRLAPIPGGREIRVSAGAFEAGNTILGIGVRATASDGSIAGFSPTIRFDLDNDSYQPASFEKDSDGRTIRLNNDGRTSFSTYAEPGDFTVQFEGSASWRGSAINVREAATGQLPAATVQLPGGVGSGTSYDFAFRAFAQPAAKSYQMFVDMTAIPKLYGSADPASAYKAFFPNKAGVGPIGDRVTVSLNGLGTNNVVFGADLTLPSVDLDVDSNNDGAIDPDNSPAGKDDRIEDTGPGKVVAVNDEDKDGDFVPDFADGYGLDLPDMDAADKDAVARATVAEEFVPVVLTLPTGSIDLSQAVVVIDYKGSNPLAVTYDRATDVYSPAPGTARLWAKPGATLRNAAAFDKSIKTGGGDYVAPGRYTLAQLGLDPAVTARQTITFYLETVQASAAAGDTRITVTLEGAPAGIGNLTDAVRGTVADLDIQRKAGDAWEDAGDMVSRYRPNPVVTVPDLTPDNLAGATYEFAERTLVARDRLGPVPQIAVSIDGNAWTPLEVAPDGQAGGVFSSSVSKRYELAGLDALRTLPLGTRKRYLFRATNSAGRTGYEELILEVRFDAAKGQNYLAPINLGAAASAQPDAVPSGALYRFRVAPALAAAGDAVLTLPTPLWMNGSDGKAKAWSSLTLDQVGGTQFVVVDAAGTPAAGAPTMPHFRRDAANPVLAAEYAPIPASFPNAKVADKATAVYFDLAAFGVDDNTEATNPSTVRYNPVNVDEATFAQNKYLMLPLKVAATVPSARGAISVTTRSLDLWTADGKKASPATQVPAAELTAAAPAKRFLVGGSTKGGISDVLVEYTYRGRVIQTDRVAFRVTDVAGLAGIPLSGAPDFQYVHTFNHTQPVSIALDPATWSQLTGYETLAGGPQARFLIHPTRTPAQWAADGTYASKNVSVTPTAPLSAVSLAANTRTLTDHAPVGQYDVVIDIADDKGEPGQNGQLDPGDIVGVFTTNPKDAEVQIVYDPLKKPAAYDAGYIDYGSSGATAKAADQFTTPAGYDGFPGTVTDHWIHGRVYYPTPLVGAAMPVEKAPAAPGGPFPLVVILHGNHLPRSTALSGVAAGALTAAQADAITSDENYLGYTYLQERLAQQGYASVSVDLDRYYRWGPGILVRAYAAAKNVDRIRAMNAAGSGSKIEGHIDFADVTLLGHSRGGEAVVELANMVDTLTGPFAAAAPGGKIAPFAISRVISLAPTAFREQSVGARPYLSIHGAADGDVDYAGGLKLYDAARAATVKASLFVPGVSHNLFNRSWPYNDAKSTIDGAFDVVDLRGGMGTPAGGTVGVYAVGGGLEDRAYHENLLAGYTLAWIWGGPYLEYFSRPAAQIGPKLSAAAVPNPIVTQFHRSTARVLDDFQAKPKFGDTSSGGSTKSERLVTPAAPAAAVDTSLDNNAEGYYQGTTEIGVELAWDNKARGGTGYYEQTPLGGVDATTTKFLSFRAGLHRSITTPTSLTAELIDASGNSVYFDVGRLGGLTVPSAARIGPYKVDPDNITKTAMQTYRVDLAALKTNGRAFDSSAITKVRFVFDRTATGRAIFDDIEFST
jgi:hypothetical protein